MKKIFLSLLLITAFTVKVKAQTLTEQVDLSLLNHVVGISEWTTDGNVKLEFIDGIIQIGHYQGDYILAFDAGFCNSVVPDAQGKLAKTYGVHLHAFSTINKFFTINPALQETLKLLELTPRYSYDTDIHHGIVGVTFGARIPF